MQKCGIELNWCKLLLVKNVRRKLVDAQERPIYIDKKQKESRK